MNPIETIEILKNHPDQTYQAGETVFAEGQRGDVMYGVIEGELEVYVDGKMVETIEAGEVFGVGALVQNEALRATTVIAKTEAKLASLDRQRFMFAVQQTPMFALAVMKSYSDRFRRLKDIAVL
jgi:CRP-like cAMP-binding protein